MLILTSTCFSLRHYVKLREGRLDEYMKVLMVVGKAMEKMHESGLAHGALSSDMVQVRETEVSQQTNNFNGPLLVHCCTTVASRQHNNRVC